MKTSAREDWLERQLRVIAAMVARIAGLRAAGSADEARAELEKAQLEVGGAKAELLRRADPATVTMLLGSSEAVALYARLVEEEAALAGDEPAAAALRERAASLRAAAASGAGGRVTREG